MPTVKSIEDLRKIREQVLKTQAARSDFGTTQIIVSMGSAAIATGARLILQQVNQMLAETHLSNVIVRQTGGIGLDSWEPVLQVVIGQAAPVTYGKLTSAAVKRILEQHVIAGQPVSDYLVPA